MLTIDTQELKPLGKAEKGPQLTVYRASAGSGKTFTLATRFIELLIKDPKSYKEILAVTFTVKATAEMKERILSQLYGLSNGLPDSESYLRQILSDFEKQHIAISEQELRLRAGKALQLIIHDYSNFNVETIDSFFQSLLRNIARELELNTNMHVELDNAEIEEIAVDRILARLKPNDKELKWIMSYIKQKMSEDNGWKVVDSIKKFGKEIFKHNYQENASIIEAKVSEEKSFDDYITTLVNIKKNADKEMIEAGKKFLNLIKENGYDSKSFASGDRGIVGYFNKLALGNYENNIVVKTVENALAGDTDKWIRGGDKGTPIHTFVEHTLQPYLIEVEKKRQDCCINCKTADTILKNIHELRLLNSIEHEVKDVTSETNRFLLSDTQPLLDKLMEGSDTPFVLEKAGVRIRHLMIDEFQDTSVIQWRNFKKLLLECMAYANSENLIVGDVKQSIYRWRNSDWDLLNNIENELAGNNIELVVLDKNFRSEKNIIDFNNAFFSKAQEIESSKINEDIDKSASDNSEASIIGRIYSSELTKQELPEAKEPLGLVDINLLSASNNEEFNPLCIELIRKHIATLLSAGANPNDIAILVRNNKYFSDIANSLKAAFPQCNFVSDEAFLLSSSVAVNIIVNAMKSLCLKPNISARQQLASDYHAYILHRDLSELIFPKARNDEYIKQINECIKNINAFLPQEFVTQEDQLRAMPLNDMAEELCHIFHVEGLKNEVAYIYAFFDQLSAFTSANSPDLDTFSTYWDETMYKKTVKGGDINGIRLLSIHKAKGLEFDHVIVPFCDWKLDLGATLWCQPGIEPFSQMPVVAVNSISLKETYFSKEYCKEKLQNTVDNLNLLYVAFTRAKKNLFVIGKLKSNKDYRSKLLKEVIPTIAEKLGATLTENADSKEDAFHFSYGSLYVNNTEKKASDNIFLQEKTNTPVDFTPSTHKVEFRQSNSSREFVSASDDDETDQKKYIKQGTIRHNVLSHIYHVSDVDRVLDRFMEEGVLSDTDPELNKAKIAKEIKQRVEDNKNPLVSEWFAEEAEVLNECSILSKDPQTGQVVKLRPDRVVRKGDLVTVIDFKFANPKEAYYTQVKTYMDLLRYMGHDNVKGYLWYVYTNNIEEVK